MTHTWIAISLGWATPEAGGIAARVRASGAGGCPRYRSPWARDGLLNGSGQVVNRYTYTPWGEVASAHETVVQPLGYMARENDPVTGLYYVRARWYAAHLGRFVSEDPIGLEGGLNVYAYVGNSPLNGTDPSGLEPYYVVEGATGYGKCERGKVRGTDGKCTEAHRSGSGTNGTGDIPLSEYPEYKKTAAEREQRRKREACLAQGGLAALNIALDLSGTRVLGAAALTGIRAGAMVGARTGVRSFATHAPPAFAPSAASIVSNVGGSLGMGYHSGHWDGKDILKLGGSFIPVIGSVLAVQDAILACQAAFN